ncbi:unnamed protein product, partial [Prorocentrum cordatum]
RRFHDVLVNEAVDSLNWLAGASVGSSTTPVTAVQLDVAQRVDGQVNDIAQGVLAPCRPGLPSLPKSIAEAPALRELLRGRARQCVEGQGERVQRDHESALEALERCPRVPFSEPSLVRGQRRCGDFARGRAKRELVSFAREVSEMVGIFFVWKKGGVQTRMILDCRRSNAWLIDPPSVQLLTAEGLSAFELEEDGGAEDRLQAVLQAALEDVDFSVGVADVKGAFRRVRLPPWMKRLFGLPALKALPMGCTWGMYLCQSATELRCQFAPSLRDGTPLSDVGKPLVLRLAAGATQIEHCVYVDNMGVIGQNGERVSSSLDELVQAFEAVGLRVHGREGRNGGIQVLGVVLGGQRLQTRPTSKRVWRVRQAIAGLLQLRAVRGDDLRALLGHCAYLGLVRRPVLCVFHSGYRFVTKMGKYSAPLWKSCREELKAFPAVLPLIVSDWWLPYNRWVQCSDASESGFGIAGGFWDLEALNSVGRWRERGEKALAESTLPRGDYEMDPEFCEVPSSLLSHQLWRSVGQGTWRYSEHIGILESRAALVKSLRRVALTRFGFHARQLLLVDRLGVALAFDRRVAGTRARPAGESSSGAASESEAAVELKRQRTLVRRVKRRRRAVARAIEGGVPPDRYLESSTVAPRVRAQYQRVLEQLKQRCGRQDFFEMPAETMGACLVHYFTSLCLLGELASAGMYVAAAVNHFYPRMPEPLNIWCALMHVLVLRGRRMMAVFLALAVSTYLRPSSLFRLRPGDIVKPGGGSQRWGPLMRPQDRATPDKVGEFDLGVRLDSSWLRWIGPVLSDMQMLDPRKPVREFDYPELLREMKAACRMLQLRPVTPYRARHSGASIDRASGERAQAEVQRRGGWRQLKNMARYGKSARLGQRAQMHGPRLEAYGDQHPALAERCKALLIGDELAMIGSGLAESGVPTWMWRGDALCDERLG